MKRIFLHLSLMLVFFNTSCKSAKYEAEEHEAILSATSPLIKDTTIIKEYVAQIKSIQHIELRALEKGYLQKVYVDEGEFVKKGKLMFQIMPNLYKAEAKKAGAEAQFAKIEYLNTKALADSNIVSTNELALAKAKYDKALAELDLANVHLGFTEIHAPFDGIVGRFHVRLGSLLDEGELLTELSDNRKVWVYFNVPEAEYLDYKSKIDKDHLQHVNLMMANNKMFNHDGVIETIESDFNNETGNIAFRATFDNQEQLLRHGETGNIQIPTRLNNAIMIPQKSTFEILEDKYVYVVDKDNIARSRKVTILNELPHIYILSEGLSKEDKVLLGGLRHVRDGQKVDIDYIKPEQVMNDLELYAE